MKQFKVIVEDEKVEFFKEMLRSLSFVKEVEEELAYEISAEQKALVKERIEQYRNSPESYLDWSEVEKRLNL